MEDLLPHFLEVVYIPKNLRFENHSIEHVGSVFHEINACIGLKPTGVKPWIGHFAELVLQIIYF